MTWVVLQQDDQDVEHLVLVVLSFAGWASDLIAGWGVAGLGGVEVVVVCLFLFHLLAELAEGVGDHAQDITVGVGLLLLRSHLAPCCLVLLFLLLLRLALHPLVLLDVVRDLRRLLGSDVDVLLLVLHGRLVGLLEVVVLFYFFVRRFLKSEC